MHLTPPHPYFRDSGCFIDVIREENYQVGEMRRPEIFHKRCKLSSEKLLAAIIHRALMLFSDN